MSRHHAPRPTAASCRCSPTRRAQSATRLPSTARWRATWILEGARDPLVEVIGPRWKPHGRLAWFFVLDAGAGVDLSVMPRQTATK